jgi:hypothetical protein
MIEASTIALYAERFVELTKNASLEDRINAAKDSVKEMIENINNGSYYAATNIFLMLNEDISWDVLLDFIKKHVDGAKLINFEKELSAIESRL